MSIYIEVISTQYCRRTSCRTILLHAASTLLPYTTLFRSIDPDVRLERNHRRQREAAVVVGVFANQVDAARRGRFNQGSPRQRSEEHTTELQSPDHIVCGILLEKKERPIPYGNALHDLR